MTLDCCTDLLKFDTRSGNPRKAISGQRLTIFLTPCQLTPPYDGARAHTCVATNSFTYLPCQEIFTLWRKLSVMSADLDNHVYR